MSKVFTNLKLAKLPLLPSVIALACLSFFGQASAQLVVYEHDGFSGRSFTTNQEVRNFKRQGFNDRASSAIVLRDRWEVCDDVRFGGRCIVLRPGRYPSFGAMGLNDRISSVRSVQYGTQYEDNRYAPQPELVYDNYRRNAERTFEAQVVSVRAVLNQNDRQCWVERDQVGRYRDSGKNVPGALAGAVIGGILGHQIGAGKGRDLATVAGVIAGVAVGSNVDRNINGQRRYNQSVRRCNEQYGGNEPQYWDVIYTFRGQEHRMQTMYPPGATVTVNRRGEPRA
jgi:uncharacterized protein YcfJ